MLQRAQEYWQRDDHHKGRVVALAITLASTLLVAGGAGAAVYIAAQGRSPRPPIVVVPTATVTRAPAPSVSPTGSATTGTTPAAPTTTVTAPTATSTTPSGASTPTAQPPSPAAATPTRQPTAPPVQQPTATPTATQPPANLGPLTLGGGSAAFIAKYGQPTPRSDTTAGELRFAQPGDPNNDFLIVQLDTFANDPVLAQRVFSITAQHPPDRFWSFSEARDICGAFLPADVHTGHRILVKNNGAVTGAANTYWSSSVAYSFPASAFVDSTQNRVVPGTFEVFFHYASAGDASRVESCELEVGLPHAPASAAGQG